jgi:HemY protein
MRRILFALVAAAIVLALAWAVFALPGRLTLEWNDTTLETSAPVAALALLVLLALVWIVLRLLTGAWRAPRAASRAWQARRRRIGEQAVTRTLVALAAGDADTARREAQRSRRLLGETPHSLLLWAEAGRLAEREDEAETAYLRLSERPDAAFLGYRGLLRQAVGRDDWTKAAELARQADAARPGAAWLRQQRTRLAIQAGDWAEAMNFADTPASKAALATGAAQVASDPTRALRLARDAWNQDPALAPAALTYAERLRSAGRETRAQAVLKRSWALQPQPELGAMALAPVTEPLARTKAAQALTEGNPDHIESRLLVARAALDAGLTGEARHQIEAARAAGCDTRRMWLLLAEIEEEERGDTEEGRLAQRTALRRAADAAPDEGWRCTACHAVQAHWAPACGECGTPGGLAWIAATPSASTLPVPV